MGNQPHNKTSNARKTSRQTDQPRSRARKSASGKKCRPTALGTYRVPEDRAREILFWHHVMFGASASNSEGGSDA